MFDDLKRQWQELKRAPAGERFETHHREQKKKPKPQWVKVLSLGGALAMLAVGVVLVFIPGPAVVFFAIGGGMLASHSLHVARALDWSEVKLRAAFGAMRRWWRGHSWAARAPVIVAAVVVVLGVGVAVFEMVTGRLSR